MNNFINKITVLGQFLHAVGMFLCMYILIAGALGAAVWVVILVWPFHFDASGVFKATWGLGGEEVPLVWRVNAWLCMTVGALAAACGFIWHLRGDRLPKGDDHHRGPQIVNRDAQ